MDALKAATLCASFQGSWALDEARGGNWWCEDILLVSGQWRVGPEPMAIMPHV